jgi:hypothetical protein
MCTALFQPAQAAEPLDGWVVNESVDINFSNPKRSRRSPNATLDATITNKSDKPLVGPLRFVITVFTPSTVTLSGGDGMLAGYHYFNLLVEGTELAVGASIKTSLMTVAGGGRTVFSINGGVYSKAIVQPKVLAVDITSPQTLLTIGASPVQVSGTLNNAQANLTLNGVPISHQNGAFTAQVELTEGFNTVVARATTTQGEQVTDSIVISLDLTPPYLTIESHTQAQEVYANTITVTGLVNDIVRGTVESAQAVVQVNGIKAVISNRSYAAHNIPLTEGDNTITVTGVDQAGNSASIVRNVTYKIVSGSKLKLESGQNQQAEVGSVLPEGLKVQLIDKQGVGIAGKTVIFRVIQGSGMVGVGTPERGRAVIVTTDSNGYAQTSFLVGLRSGVANHKVKAKVVGYKNDIVFTASAISVIGDKISVNSGNNQHGIVGQKLPAPFIIAVSDHGANTVKGARVRFNVIKGEGVFQNNEKRYETTTDSDGRASAQLTLGELTGIDAQRVEAVLIDSPTNVKLLAGFSATGFIAAEPGNTSVSGIILDNQDKPIPGITVRIENTDRFATTNQQGQFTITQAPVGPVHIIVDGSTATVAGEFPSLGYHLVTISGVDNPMSSPVYMVKLDTENGVLAGKDDVVLTLDNFPGFKLEIAKDSVTFPNGSREGIISVTSVNASKVPMTPPNGMQPQFIVTIQPVGATFFPAAKLTLPNIDGHAPGTQVEMYSFDHDLEEFVVIGLGTVSEDGSIVRSNPGIGVIKAGWHMGAPPIPTGTVHDCPTCQACIDTSCVPDDKNIPEIDTVPGNCFKSSCDGGIIIENKDPDDTDITEEDEKCNTCSEDGLIIDKDKEKKSCGGNDLNKACYTCKDGTCGNHCEADKDRNVTTVAIPPQVTKALAFLTEATKKIKGVSPIAVTLGVTGDASLDQGKGCCDTCTEPTSEEVVENKWSVKPELVATAQVTAGIPIPSYSKYDGDSRFIIAATAGLTGVVTGKASPVYKFTEKLGCAEDEVCHNFSAKIAVGGDVSLGGTVVLANQTWDFDSTVYKCNFNGRKREKAKYNNCWKKEGGLDAILKGGARVDASINSSTDTCEGPKACEFTISPIEVYYEATFSLNLILIEINYTWKPEPMVLREKSDHSCM